MLLTSRAREINYILYVLELSHAAYCNLIGARKYLNGDKLDVHDSLDPLSLPGCVGGAGYETKLRAHTYIVPCSHKLCQGLRIKLEIRKGPHNQVLQKRVCQLLPLSVKH